MTGKFFLAFLTLHLGVFCSPTRQSLSPATSVLQTLKQRDVPQCGPSTGIKCGMNVCCSGAGFCGVSYGHPSAIFQANSLLCFRQQLITVQPALVSLDLAAAKYRNPRSAEQVLGLRMAERLDTIEDLIPTAELAM
jgi:hypothetical protein